MRTSQALEGFVFARRAAGVSPHTVLCYRWGWTPLIRWLGDPELDQVQPEQLRAYFYQLREQGKYAEASLQMVWRVISAFYTWASVELGIPRADRLLERPGSNGRKILPYTHDELSRLLKACDFSRLATPKKRKSFQMRRPTAKRDRAIVLILVDTGLRAGELCRLRIEDVDLASGRVEVKNFRKGLKSKARVVKLGKAARHAVWLYLTERSTAQNSDPLVLTSKGNAWSSPSIFHLVRELGNRAGVAGAHPHRFRHTFAIQYLRNGGDIFTLQELLGHESLVMVRKYLEIAEADIDTSHERNSPADRWGL